MVKRSREGSISSSLDADTPASVESSAPSKFAHVDAESAPIVMKCLLPPHQPLSFSSYEEYDIHYQKNHVNRCSDCHTNLPSEHYLGIHIAENHDPINEARRARGEKTYSCLLPDCDRICSTPQKRRLHCIDKHQFPKYYDFSIVVHGIDKRNSMLRTHRRRSSAATTIPIAGRRRSSSNVVLNGSAHGQSSKTVLGQSDRVVHARELDVGGGHAEDKQKMETQDEESDEDSEEESEELESEDEGDEGDVKAKLEKAMQKEKMKTQAKDAAGKGGDKADDAIDAITSGMSSLKFVPPSVRFGRGRGRGRGGLARS